MIDITPSVMLEYLYCPRFIYFMKVLDIPQNEEKRFKVEEGRRIHKKKSLENGDYARKKLNVEKKLVEQEVYDPKNSIHGIIDEILFFKDGTAAPLDYKYAVYKNKIFKTYKIQSLMYGLMIKSNYGVEVNKGYIVYTRSRNHIEEILFKKADYKKLLNSIDDINNIVTIGKYPRATSCKSRCNDCCYRNICVK